MGIRTTIAGLVLEGVVRDVVEQVLSTRTYVTPAELQTVKQDLAKVAAGSDDSGVADRLDLLEKRIASLEKKQSMTMGAVQAGTTEIMGAKNAAAQAAQQATSAAATAEAAADGISALEERLDALEKGAATAPAAGPAANGAAAPAKAKKAAGDKGCNVPGCDGSHRARGFCGKHYQMWKRNTLPGFVAGDGSIIDDSGNARFKVDDKLSGKTAKIAGGQVLVDGQRVEAQAVAAEG